MSRLDRSVLAAALLIAATGGCKGAVIAEAADGGRMGEVRDAEPVDRDTGVDGGALRDAGAPTPCTTRVTYGAAWIRPAGRATDHDIVDGLVTWDGVCHFDGSSSYAELSNGWQPFFAGRSTCVIGLDVAGDCELAPPAQCETRVGYGASWLRGPDHPANHDDVSGVVTWDGSCFNGGGQSSAPLSNGWVPHFSGASACEISFRYSQCGGLFSNPVIGRDCPDPGVARDGARYVMACTSGGASAAFPLRTSTDLVRWSDAGHVFPSGTRPAWASGDFWAPELHRVGDRWLVYYSARNAADGSLALGAATADDPLGPYTDLGRPLLHDPNPGVIDAHYFEAPDGSRYLTWKVDGNAVGRPTPIYIQPVAADGTTLTGSRTEILRNDRAWEGGLVEGQWMVHRDGTYYLFYSGNGYATTRYAAGVARASSPLGPFTKLADPILTSNHAFAGPGHGSVLLGPRGDWVHVYHAWVAGRVGSDPGRLVLVDRVDWHDGWPAMASSPSPRSQPLP
jgi:GH43 family beta-xylosidase